MERYQDYVIKDGQFVGKFDEMYKRFDDPWHQTELQHHILSKSRNAALLNIEKYGIRSVAEFGCGLGYFSHLIDTRTRAKVLGIDISETAIRKAKQNFPKVDFVADDITNIKNYSSLDAFLFAEITWYILPSLRGIFDQMLQYCRGKYFLHNLVFYKGGVQKYGKEYFSTFEEFARFCPFKLIEWNLSSTEDPSSTIETSAVFLIEPK